MARIKGGLNAKKTAADAYEQRKSGKAEKVPAVITSPPGK